MDVTLGAISQIPPGEGRAFAVAGQEFAVFRLRNGEVYASQAACPHRGGPLADGLTDGHTVTCPLHDRVYDLRSGQGIGTDCNVAVFPVRVTGDGTMVLSLAREMAIAD